MSLTEFRETQDRLECRHCGHVGLNEYRSENGPHIGARCPACLSNSPLSQQWFAQDTATTRRPKLPKSITTEEVWRVNGDRCSYCGKSSFLCREIGLHLTIQHVVPVVYGGNDGPLIPFCSRCQQGSAAALAETRQIEGRFLSLKERFAQFEELHPELRGGLNVGNHR